MTTTTNLALNNGYSGGETLPSTQLNSIGNYLEALFYGVGSIAHDDTPDYTPTVSAARYPILVIGGALTAARNLVLETASGAHWMIFNNTTGGFGVTVKTSAGTGIAIPNGKRALVYCDGTNILSWGSGLRLDSPVVATAILATDGSELLKTSETIAAVNELTLVNAAAGTRPRLQASGDDANVSPAIRGKGTGGVVLEDGNGNEVLICAPGTASAVNEVTLTNQAAGTGPLISASGADANIDLRLQGKGTGVLLPLATVKLAAGTAAMGPLQYQSGTNLTTPVAGTAEYDGKSWFFTPVSTRRVVDLSGGIITATTTVANTITPTDLANLGLDANSLNVGKTVSLRILGRYSTANGTDTVSLAVKIGGTTFTTIVTTAGTVTNAALDLTLTFTVRSIGAAGTVWGFVRATVNAADKSVAGTATTSLDTTVAQTVSVAATWSNALAGNTISVDQAWLELRG